MKKFGGKLILAVIPLLLAAAASAHPPYAQKGELSVSRDVVINHAPDKVWDTVGGFFALDDWHPAVAKVLVREGGMVRVLVLGDGAEVHERLLKYKHRRAYTYSIFQGPWPITDYVSTVKIKPAGRNATRVTWSSTFNSKNADEMVKTFTNVYDAGLQNLAKMMK